MKCNGIRVMVRASESPYSAALHTGYGCCFRCPADVHRADKVGVATTLVPPDVRSTSPPGLNSPLNTSACIRPVKHPRPASNRPAGDVGGGRLGSEAAVEDVGGYWYSAAGAAFQFRGNSSVRRRLGCVGIRSSTSLRYAYASIPCSLHVA